MSLGQRPRAYISAKLPLDTAVAGLRPTLRAVIYASHCPGWKPPATCGDWALEMWLLSLRSQSFYLIKLILLHLKLRFKTYSIYKIYSIGLTMDASLRWTAQRPRSSGCHSSLSGSPITMSTPLTQAAMEQNLTWIRYFKKEGLEKY